MSPNKEEIVKKLKKLPLLESLNNNYEVLNKITEIIYIKNIKPGEAIIREDEEGETFYILYAGKVEITKKTRHNDSFTVDILNADNNSCFGELALIDDELRSATVVAINEVTLLAIDKSDFIKMGNNNTKIGLEVTRVLSKIMAQRMRKSTQDMITVFDALINEVS